MAQHKKKYLDPEKLKQIGSLEIVARQVVEGLRIGSHKSPARGISSEFSAYRQYVAGDEQGTSTGRHTQDSIGIILNNSMRKLTLLPIC